MARGMISTIIILAGLLLSTVPLVAQNTSGSITGVVQDATGAVIPGATATGIGQAELNRRITGSEDFAPRIAFTCNPNLPGRFIQLRLEAYNVFNRTNWNTMNTIAQFNATTGQLVNAASPTNPAGFGALTTVRAAGTTGSPRIIQVAAKFNF